MPTGEGLADLESHALRCLALGAPDAALSALCDGARDAGLASVGMVLPGLPAGESRRLLRRGLDEVISQLSLQRAALFGDE